MNNRKTRLGLLAAAFAVLSFMAVATVHAAPDGLNIKPEPGVGEFEDLPKPILNSPITPVNSNGSTPTGTPTTTSAPTSTPPPAQELPTAPKAAPPPESSTTNKKKPKQTPGQELPDIARQPGDPNAPGAAWAPAPE
ncbi:hypothetical protein ACFWBG_20305 [Nocardia salmonicida]|uniref:hypothetical protein n=1 Tax=Nocardia salmonicida TaxID=53431 RepID=UPI00366F1A44